MFCTSVSLKQYVSYYMTKQRNGEMLIIGLNVIALELWIAKICWKWMMT